MLLSDERVAELAAQAVALKEYQQRDELRAQAERAIRQAVRETAEECAKVCDGMKPSATARLPDEQRYADVLTDVLAFPYEQCAAAIRERAK